MSEELKSCPFCGSSGNCDVAFPHPSENPTNWPNPERPGVPLFPERDGWHWLSYGQNQEPVPFEWSSEEFSDAPTEWAWGTDGGPEDAYEMARRFCYHGPCLTPTQIAEMLAGERERCARICNDIGAQASLHISELSSRTHGALLAQPEKGRMDAAYECAGRIRNLGAAP